LQLSSGERVISARKPPGAELNTVLLTRILLNHEFVTQRPVQIVSSEK